MIIEDTIPTVETSLNEGDPSIIDFLPNEGETEYKFQNEGASNLQLPKTNQREGGDKPISKQNKDSRSYIY